MPIYRFQTHEEAERALWLEPGDPRIPRVLRFLWSVGSVLTLRFPPPRGVQKFRSIEEANAARDAWETERIHWLQETRAKKAKARHKP